jgi:hypothetical protein
MYGVLTGPSNTNTQDTGYFITGISEKNMQKTFFNKLVTLFGAFQLLLINK